jgi:hypothetical protein
MDHGRAYRHFRKRLWCKLKPVVESIRVRLMELSSYEWGSSCECRVPSRRRRFAPAELSCLEVPLLDLLCQLDSGDSYPRDRHAPQLSNHKVHHTVAVSLHVNAIYRPSLPTQSRHKSAPSRGPAVSAGPPGIRKKPAPNSSLHIPPRNAPRKPQKTDKFLVIAYGAPEEVAQARLIVGETFVP